MKAQREIEKHRGTEKLNESKCYVRACKISNVSASSKDELYACTIVFLYFGPNV